MTLDQVSNPLSHWIIPKLSKSNIERSDGRMIILSILHCIKDCRILEGLEGLEDLGGQGGLKIF